MSIVEADLSSAVGAFTDVTRRERLDFETLFRHEYRVILGTVRFLVADEGLAAEVTQEAFARALRHWRRVSRHDRPGAWVRRVAIREARRVSRRRSRVELGDLDDAPGQVGATTGLDDGPLRQALALLSPNQRAAVVLHYVEDQPVDRVAEILGCAASTARVHLHRGRNHLAELLGTEEGR